MESWDDDNFEPPAPVVAPIGSNRWEGEDEEDEVKESWEDEDEDKKRNDRKEEMERRLREQEEIELTPEEKLRQQQESDLKIALETTFGGEKVSSGIDDLSMPNSKEEFETFTEALSKKLTPLSKSVEYPIFIENLTRNLCATMSSLDIKKIKNSLDNLYLEKQKIEKGDKTKKNKGKGKAKLKMEGDNQLSQLSAYVNDYDDYDDFM
ncbi:hypothetical protein NQ314_017335 [Rhamnusium bicolor]|uniref:Eukaryotic translation initiation factor 3 subunit J n=1 Tax=Rhamnusium bicolor TaxID=1586634 RepID=A0AAV8WTX8_9CUCU|nr:hypothetical protein NQ314_017335 [Rhamnusium bicolor]